ncbi:LLM class flavin-dependent oxidoreductase [Nonomuraea sp. MCN248]|uniref:LLM class flavin-dependent oxidoreductase n=1 Tax=Nonomuraea corallina TaxID=2989783 RepID=A0ABT4SBU9_9ACTN|nr:LLM class flavin-dependent oxidoreductase [Nonomuraea corallina]MDA0634440.1 LLM class flavin-dependent oxidoreductase [Nonomuraea corallina]
MKFLAITLIVHNDDRSPTERFREVVENAVLAEELGFDGFGVGERHERPFISSSPPVVLSHIAARTSRIRLFTAVTTLSLLDPVRAYEDYATLDHLSEGRLELIIGKGNGAAQAQLFHVTPEDQWERNREAYELFSANVTHPIGPYAELIDHYRERWAHYGHDPAGALVGAGTAGYYAARTSQEALAVYRPIFDARVAFQRELGLPVVFPTLEDAVERSSILVGSPQQIVDKVLRYHKRFGHEVMHLHADADGLTPRQHRDALELFQAEIAPVLRAEIPSRPFPGGAA